MAPATRPARAARWPLIAVVIVALVGLDGSHRSSTTPKLGLDLQGGTSVTLIPKAAPAAAP